MAGAERPRYAVAPGVGSVFFTADQLRLVSDMAGPGGRVELNSFMQLIVHPTGEDLDAQFVSLRAAGLGIYPVGSVVKNIHTCTFCMGERVDALPDALQLDQAVAGMPVPFPVRVGLSGCANNCGETMLRDVGIVLMRPGQFDIYVGARPGGLDPSFGIKVAEAVPSADLVPCVRAILDCYRQSARGKERFWKCVRRLGPEPFQAAAASIRSAP